ncbi:unnamed protein product [Hymenolepis diminuta]|uniref:Uncharacterized protein n=1 Tax=Hymenolepis diminuta TaxID=6216 RepID=A0A564ZD83_HYMDI|nr:unnamed protein product [Hymenolepis diminuta]
MQIKAMMKLFAAASKNILGKCTQTTVRLGLFLKLVTNCMFRPKRSVLIAAMKILENEQRVTSQGTVFAFESVQRDVRHILTESIRNRPVSTDNMREETVKDAVLQQALKFIHSEWPFFPPKGDLLNLYCQRDSIPAVDSSLIFHSALRNFVL